MFHLRASCVPATGGSPAYRRLPIGRRGTRFRLGDMAGVGRQWRGGGAGGAARDNVFRRRGASRPAGPSAEEPQPAQRGLSAQRWRESSAPATAQPQSFPPWGSNTPTPPPSCRPCVAANTEKFVTVIASAWPGGLFTREGMHVERQRAEEGSSGLPLNG